MLRIDVLKIIIVFICVCGVVDGVLNVNTLNEPVHVEEHRFPFHALESNLAESIFRTLSVNPHLRTTIGPVLRDQDSKNTFRHSDDETTRKKRSPSDVVQTSDYENLNSDFLNPETIMFTKVEEASGQSTLFSKEPTTLIKEPSAFVTEPTISMTQTPTKRPTTSLKEETQSVTEVIFSAKESNLSPRKSTQKPPTLVAEQPNSPVSHMSNQPKSTETSNLNGDLLSQKGDIVAGSTKDSEKSILQYLPNSDLQIEVEDEATIDEDNVDSSNIFNSNSSQKMTEKVIANESFEMSESDLDEVSIESNDKSASEVGEKSEDDQVTDQNDLKDFFDEDGAFVDVDKRKKRDVITNVQSSQVLNNIPSNKSSKVLSHEGHKINLAKPMHSGTVKKIRNFLRIKKTSKSGNVNISTKIFTKSKVDYDDSLLDDLKNETVFTTNLPSQTITQTHLLLTKDKIMNVSKESNAGDQLGLNVKNNTVSTQIILTTNESKEQTPFIVFRMVKKMDVKPSKTVTFEEINVDNPNVTLTNISNTTSPDITNEKGTFDSDSVEKTILETSHETEKMKSFKKLNSAFDHGEESS